VENALSPATSVAAAAHEPQPVPRAANITNHIDTMHIAVDSFANVSKKSLLFIYRVESLKQIQFFYLYERTTGLLENL
jgi:hypothetical protein